MKEIKKLIFNLTLFLLFVCLIGTVSATGDSLILNNTTDETINFDMDFSNNIENTTTKNTNNSSNEQKKSNKYLKNQPLNYRSNSNKPINITGIWSGSTNFEIMTKVSMNYPYIRYRAFLTSKLPKTLNLANEKIIFLDLYDDKYNHLIKEQLELAKKNGAKIIVLSPQSTESKKFSTVDLSKHPNILKYFKNGGYENDKRLLDYSLNKFGGYDTPIENPIDMPLIGIYHPKSKKPFDNVNDYLNWYKSNGNHYKYDSKKPTIAILFHKDSYIKGDIEWVNKIIYKYESKGINCIAEFGQLGDSLSLLLDKKKLKLRTPLNLVITTKSYRLNSYSNEPMEDGVKYLKAVNVPIIHAIASLYQISPDEWLNSSAGIPSNSVGSKISLPEIDGITEQIIIAGQVKNDKTEVYSTVIIPDQLNWLIDRSIAWINLQIKSNKDKKISLIYYHHSSGKDSVGIMDEGGLNTHKSLINVLKALKAKGYNLGGKIPTLAELKRSMISHGSNIGVWAPGELEKMVKTGEVELIPLNQYLKWFNNLPKKNRDAVISKWGTAPGNIMVYEKLGSKYIVIPRLKYGNVLLAPQPMRSKGQDPKVLFNGNTTPPTHQYIAFYFWMSKIYNTDALVHFGTYGSFEYLPGKEKGLSAKYDWPAILIQDMPHLYLYSVDGVGGATQAKRRANAVIIDYSTPAIIASGLYGDLANLEKELVLYDQISDPKVKTKQREKILNLISKLKIDKDLKIDLKIIKSEKSFETFKIQLRDYLTDVKKEYMPYGLHTIGEGINENNLVSMIKSMLGSDFLKYTKTKNISNSQLNNLLKEITNGNNPINAQKKIVGKTDEKITQYLDLAVLYNKYLSDNTQEINSLIYSLEGKFVLPGPGGDPIRNPNAYPTGRNIFSFDPREIPIKSARDLGVQMANDLLNKHLKEKGKYPKKVAQVLWFAETSNHFGVTESMILTLLGIELDYDKYNRPTKLKLIPSNELKRPRIDVLLATSGIYRDNLPIQIGLLNKAIKMAATAEDKNYPNYVKLNSEKIYKSLIKQGMDKEIALNLSYSRIFSAEIGSYGPSIGTAAGHSDQWKNSNEIAKLYIDGFGYVYGDDNWGKKYKGLFEENLNDVDVAIHSVSSNNYGLLYGDGYASSLGGLSLAIKSLSGKNPTIYINNLRDINNAKIDNLAYFLSKELRSRNLNSKWIKGMMNEGNYGAGVMASNVENLWIWSVTEPNTIEKWMFDEFYETYIKDKHNLGLKEFFNKNNPYARQSIALRLLEANRKGYWDTTDEIKRELTDEFIKSVLEYGVTCCHHTCGNIQIDNYLMHYSTLSRSELLEYSNMMKQATNRNIKVPGMKKPSNSQTPSNKVSTQNSRDYIQNVDAKSTTNRDKSSDEKLSNEIGESTQSKDAYELKENTKSNGNSSSMSIYAILLVLFLLCLFVGGYYLEDIKRHLKR